VLDEGARVVAKFADGTPAAYEHAYGKGSGILLGTFAGQHNEEKPVPMHPLGAILANWAGLHSPGLKAPALVELREMEAADGRVVFLFNHGEKAAEVEFAEELGSAATREREIIMGQTIKPSGTGFHVKTQVPAQAVRVYRIDY
jgi:hypothetical protein